MPQLYVKQPTGRYRIAETACILDAASQVIDASFATGQPITSPESAETCLKIRLAALDHEVFYVLFLTTQHRVIQGEVLFHGTINASSVYPREVVKRALHHNAAALILAHNHPSGEASPSQADEAITQRLKQALDLIDVSVLDHLIVGKTIYSFAQNGKL